MFFLENNDNNQPTTHRSNCGGRVAISGRRPQNKISRFSLVPVYRGTGIPASAAYKLRTEYRSRCDRAGAPEFHRENGRARAGRFRLAEVRWTPKKRRLAREARPRRAVGFFGKFRLASSENRRIPSTKSKIILYDSCQIYDSNVVLTVLWRVSNYFF